MHKFATDVWGADTEEMHADAADGAASMDARIPTTDCCIDGQSPHQESLECDSEQLPQRSINRLVVMERFARRGFLQPM